MMISFEARAQIKQFASMQQVLHALNREIDRQRVQALEHQQSAWCWGHIGALEEQAISAAAHIVANCHSEFRQAQGRNPRMLNWKQQRHQAKAFATTCFERLGKLARSYFDSEWDEDGYAGGTVRGVQRALIEPDW